MAYYRQPEFYRSFHCMGGKCPNSCCAKWRIDWTKDEVEKLKASDCSPKLRKLIEESFVPQEENENVMEVQLREDKNRDCPFLTEDRMCSIQRELGEEYLSHTCSFYPRTVAVFGNIVYRTCSSSCYEVMETLCSDLNAMSLYSVPVKETVTIPASQDTKAAIKNHPELKYRSELFEFFYEIIGNKKRSLETSLVLGALAAQKLNEYINLGQQEQIPEVIKALRPQLNLQTVPAFENTTPKYGISLGIVGKIVDTFNKSNLLNVFREDGKLSVEKYLQGREQFDKFLEENPHIMRNLALNFLFEGKMPFFDTSKTLFENYCYYVSTIATVRTLGCAVALMNSNIKSGFYFAVSYFVRSMYHSEGKSPKKILEILSENNCNSPSFLALMLK